MNALDWIIVILYLAGMIGLSVYLSKGQKTVEDYYLGGNKIKWWQISLSTMATQCSTNSLLGAPAFVAFAAGGGLIWLQYELAVPLAMIVAMIFLFPFYRSANVVSIYEYLEMRFGPGSRTVLSLLFQFLRAFSTGVTVYGISLVIHKCMGLPLGVSIIVLAVITIVYDSIGGIKAVIASDVIQMVVLLFGVLLIGYYALDLVGGFDEMIRHADKSRLLTIDFGHHGLGDGKTFAFWPMLIGGLFLYVSYYGCDQTQVQRELSSTGIDDSRRSLFMNGILRFPLVLAYCFTGVAIGSYAMSHPEFMDLLPLKADGSREFNLAAPTFVLEYLPHGVIGIIMVALFAAAMSSLDSTINSLSAMTEKDIFERYLSKGRTEAAKLWWSKGATVFWGTICTIFAFFVSDISDSIIESINKIGSLINGPILATFLLAILTKRATGEGTVTGIIFGFGINLLLWKFAPGISWLWWNVIGCGATFFIGYGVSLFFPKPSEEKIRGLTFSGEAAVMAIGEKKWRKYYFLLAGYAVFILAVLVFINQLFT
ncbi:MAG: sodium:solute symporter [Fibrobacteria bacterium]|nr:sodium:solute symporter [Fibrobacteria bacterium]